MGTYKVVYVMGYNLFKLSKDRGNENPNLFVDSPVDVYESSNNTWIVEDVVSGRETEFLNREDAEEYAASIERHYEYGDDDAPWEEEY